MFRAIVRRDCEYDGIFFAAVKTTGVFCRPSCPARKPRERNIEYFPTAKEALYAGYRPCLRCRPMDADGRPPPWVARLIDAVERSPADRLRDRDLRAMTIEPSRARRYFNEHYGMTFQAYHRARRMGMALARLREGGDLMTVAMKHGYQSNSAFRDAFEKTFGKTPGAGRRDDCIVATVLPSPVGSLLLGATDKALCLLEFSDRRALESQLKTLRARFECTVVPGRNSVLDQAADELSDYFAGRLRHFRTPLDFPGTPFQVAVWKRLLQIPYGQTISYERLAEDIGRPGAQRAVGTANGSNRIAIIIPCHRVVNKGGKLGGYGGGLWRKQLLLDLERGQRTIPSR
ncbi:MAG: bifunctional transcriptional activator/DNA repair protein Ada [Phycisphaerae bacterium]|nr:bifunctional transcriptional activator/DNA repair protein Ada [Phycisphaerae bacterium]